MNKLRKMWNCSRCLIWWIIAYFLRLRILIRSVRKEKIEIWIKIRKVIIKKDILLHLAVEIMYTILQLLIICRLLTSKNGVNLILKGGFWEDLPSLFRQLNLKCMATVLSNLWKVKFCWILYVMGSFFEIRKIYNLQDILIFKI